MRALLDQLALAVTAAGALSGAFVLARTRQVGLALGVLLDLLTAAGLLRLAGPPSVQRTAAAALVVLIRHLAVIGLTAARRP